MVPARHGTSLPETLLALVLLAALAAWALTAAMSAERHAGRASLRRAALHRAERALADLAALPCDTTHVSTAVIEPRWHLASSRAHAGASFHDMVRLESVRGDTVALHRSFWCGS